MEKYLLVSLDDTVVFPNMTVTIPLDTAGESRLLLVRGMKAPMQRSEPSSTSSRRRASWRCPRRHADGGFTVLVHAAESGTGGRLYVEVEERPDETPPPVKTRELETEYRAVVQEILELREADARIGEFLRSVVEPGALADTCAYSPDLTFEQRVRLLETTDVVERLELALSLQRERLAELQVRGGFATTSSQALRPSSASTSSASSSNRSGRSSARTTLTSSTSIAGRSTRLPCPRRSVNRPSASLGLERMGDASGEASMIRTYLDWLLAVPWGETSDERLDPKVAREILDADHAGLEDVKDRIVEYLAVRKLRQERGIAEDKRSGAILTLIGPPGTGKTSIGESIARALNREFVRMSLGGVRDEAGCGHRRTYIGALGPARPCPARRRDDEPGDHARRGRQGRRRLARRPVGRASRGARPGAEPFVRDHYLDVELDLSNVVFIATRNIAETIPGRCSIAWK